MIEITAKQLYDIYSELPALKFYDEKDTAMVKIFDYKTAKSIAVKFASTKNLEWKPTTDLIIKA